MHLIVTDTAGRQRMVPGQPGRSVMEVLREAGFDDLLALCGGTCSCATCHVVVAPAFWDRLPPMTESEDDLLDSSEYRAATSRLSCQIRFDPELDGLPVTIAPQD